jgi:hypothetical protein
MDIHTQPRTPDTGQERPAAPLAALEAATPLGVSERTVAAASPAGANVLVRIDPLARGALPKPLMCAC